MDDARTEYKGDIDISLKYKQSKGYVFSASGSFKERGRYERGWSYSFGGQCLDIVKSIIKDKNKDFNFIYAMWQKYHMNDMHAECVHQRAAGWLSKPTNDILMKPCTVCGYKYGSSWLYEPIKPVDLEYIINFMTK